LKILASSAYKYNFELSSCDAHNSGRSFIYIKNNNGPKMLPRGIPLNTSNEDENSPLTPMLCFRHRPTRHTVKSLQAST